MPIYNASQTMGGAMAIATSLTNIFTKTLDPGWYYFRCRLPVAHSGTPTVFTVTPAFSGTATSVAYTVVRTTAAGIAMATHSIFAASASSVWLLAEIEGEFQVTAAGNFTIGCTRTGGTASIVQSSAFLETKPAWTRDN